MPDFVLTLFVAGEDETSVKLLDSIRRALAESCPADAYKVEVVDVLLMPEKALAEDVFATPTLVRRLPLPVVKVLGDVARSKTIMALLRDGDISQKGVIL